MPTAEELLADAKGNPLASALAAGVVDISQQQQITFTKFVKFTLPIDGSVFWLKAVGAAAQTITVNGSLHYATDQVQGETETPDIHHVVFTALDQIQDFNLVDPDTLFIADFEGFQFSFAGRRAYYKQADLHHYFGDAVYPIMQTQVINDPSTFVDLVTPVVSNSLPLWLSLDKVIPVYPAFLVPANAVPPYAAVYIDPDKTQALTSAPYLSDVSSHYQQARDAVKITIYGARNDVATQYLDYLFDYFENYCEGQFSPGIANMPVIADLHRTQSELGVIAQKKLIAFRVNYYQMQMRNIARRLIESAMCKINLGS